ncbi:DNA-binding response regulator [Dyadobacter crusticola]|uniref:DNA-binding response regulator n=1 Tax=Dyadobacter crusticola TaxID=292407 RepID=UPI0004E1A421|nr:LuxR C-terminal-related transcriptional regulator [Dyadobacter crusticola]
MNALIVTSNHVFSLGLQSVVAARLPLGTFFEVNSLQRAGEIIYQHDFKILVLDAVSTRDSKSVHLIKTIKNDFPELGILVDLGDQLLDIYFYIRLGVTAFVSKRATSSEVQDAVITSALNPNTKYVSSDIEQLLLSQLSSTSDTIGLTAKQTLIAKLLVSTRSRSEIAQTVGLSPNTVSNYKRIIFKKLGIASIPQLKVKMQMSNMLG